ncbi:MAG: group III truncated hemoglobin [Gemmatirosa sp.]
MSKSLPITVALPDTRDATRADAPPDVDDAALIPLLTAFYAEVERDAMLQPYFAPLDMAAHIPRIADFWSTLLFHTGRYRDNAFRPHAEMPGLTAEHFGRWLATLERVVDAHHAGPAAEQMKALGHRVAYSMQLRLGITPFAPFRALND